jgi:hypothetical protein
MTRTVRIFRPSKSATQSARGKQKEWLLTYSLETKRQPEPLMGWTQSADTLNQVTLLFKTIEEAIEFSNKNGWKYTISEPKPRRLKGRTYLDNFKYLPPTAPKN